MLISAKKVVATVPVGGLGGRLDGLGRLRPSGFAAAGRVVWVGVAGWLVARAISCPGQVVAEWLGGITGRCPGGMAGSAEVAVWPVSAAGGERCL